MLVAIIGVRVASGSNSFDFITLAKSPVAASLQTWFFLGFALAFAIKTPLFPFSSWLPDAYVEGPTSTSVMLASLMSKVGAYGFLRFCLGLFPDASRQFTPLIGTLAVITILYGAWSAITQRDLKGVISYSSLGHLGLIVLGIFALNASGVEGSLFLMVAHGISICALFLLVHAIEVRWGTREIGRLGGLQHPAPALAAVLLLALLSAMPLPGLNSFPGEFLILRGVFAGFPSYAYGVLAALGVVLAAAYVIWTYTRTAYYAPSAVVAEAHGGHVDLRGSDWLTFAPLVAIIFALGFLPGLVLVKTGPSATAIAQQAHGTAAQVPADSVRLVQSSTVIAR
jgi:NADH-quinone oxidoreductase subunit M